MTDHTRINLERIARLLEGGLDPARVVESATPNDPESAAAMARRLSLWDEYAGEFGQRAVACARLATLRGIKRFGDAKPRPPAEWRFTLDLGVPVSVTYTTDYFSGTDHFYFVGPGDPPAPHILSPTGYWSHFVPRDVVTAWGGPDEYAKLLAEAKTAGKESEFEAAFKEPERKERRRRVETPEPVEPVPDEPPPEPPAVEKTRRTWTETATKPVQRGLF